MGFTPGAVAIAVRRALGHTTNWADHTFEIVHEGPQSPAMHMALDQVLAEALARDKFATPGWTARVP